MGIKYFFSWLKNSFPDHIKTISTNSQSLDDYKIEIDNLLIDMNGIFHYCCQKVYKYGVFKENKPLLLINKKTSSTQKQKELYEMVGNYIDKLINIVKPSKRVFLAIDGPAPISKINQQRQRRFKTAMDNSDGIFDSNCITPGTRFLDNMSRYIDWFIRKKEYNLDVIFSSEKCPGEGEHKLVKYVRDHGIKEETFMIKGMDADLFMLSLATHFPKFYILRENPYKYENEYYYIDISSIRETIVNVLLCDHSLLDDKIHINDFILMIFLTGNDFLPHIPTIEIIEGGVENLFETYRLVSKQHGSLTTSVNTLNINALQSFIGTLGLFEKQFLEEKRSKPIPFPDKLLEKHTKLGDNGNFIIDFEKYKKEYYSTKMNIHTQEEIKQSCIDYIEGLQWVLTYYLNGVPNWRWFYKHNYSPFLSDIANYMSDYVKPSYLGKQTKPFLPFMQLLCVLPSKSKELLPHPLENIMTLNDTKQFYPSQITLDLDGKRNEYEAIINLPLIDYSTLEKKYNSLIKSVDDKDLKRNISGRSFIYKLGDMQYTYKSFYGDIKNCKVVSNIF